MEAIYLQSMTDFVLEFSKTNHNSDEFENTITDYANFLKQPLQLGFFVPCDENGNVLKGKPLSPAPDSEWIRWENEEFEFYEALERVLFKGFRLIANSNIPRIENGHCAIFLEDIAKMKIEDLLQKLDALELTETAIKQIGL